MKLTILLLIACTWGYIAICFFRNYLERRKLPSLICAVMPIGWIGLSAQLLGVIPKGSRAIDLLLSLAMTGGLVGAAIMVNWRVHQK